MISCLWHDDRTPSCKIYHDHIYCFGCAKHADTIELWGRLNGYHDYRSAFHALCKKYGLTDQGKRKKREAVKSVTRDATPEDCEALATLRNVQPDAVMVAAKRGLVKFGTQDGIVAWYVTDRTGKNLQARRMDGKGWHQIGNAKAWTMKGCSASWPIGLEEARCFPLIALVEGGPDLLAAHHFALCEEKEDRVGVVCITGAANRIPQDAVQGFAGKRVRIFPHMDAEGRQAARRWKAQLNNVALSVDAFGFDNLRCIDGHPVGDLNDLCSIDPDQFEEDRELWELMP
jgi:predicted Fe-S protein YdhL (DUF1289 family)